MNENKLENSTIKHVITNEMEYIQFQKLLSYPEIKHAYILKTHAINFRLGKKSRNITYVQKNLQKASEEIGFSYLSVVRPDFEHTAKVKIIENLNPNEMPELSGNRFKSTDGLLTKTAGITLMATNADCNLILLYDPVQKVIGNIHAGWRGTFQKIASHAISKMKNEFGSQSHDIICCFCPSIRKCHFEVDEDVAKQCHEIFSYTGNIKEIIEKGGIKDNKQKYYIDTVLINKILLQNEGISSQNIIDCGICSVCHANKIHSRRAHGFYFGLGASFIEKTS